MKSLSIEQQKRVITSLQGWAWNPIESFINGIRFETAPASESSEKRNGVLRCVMSSDVDINGAKKQNGPSRMYLLSLRAGITLDGTHVVPKELIEAVGLDQDTYQETKNKLQITVSFNPDSIPQHAEYLDLLDPRWRTVIPQVKGQPSTAANMLEIAPSTLRVAVRLSLDSDGNPIMNKKGAFLFRAEALEVINRSELFEEGSSFQRTLVDTNAVKAKLEAAKKAAFGSITNAERSEEKQPEPTGRKADELTPASVFRTLKAEGIAITMADINAAIAAGFTLVDVLDEARIAKSIAGLIG